nr:MAG TPA: hypothetical protein [Caudoviricetes sp.]
MLNHLRPSCDKKGRKNLLILLSYCIIITKIIILQRRIHI